MAFSRSGQNFLMLHERMSRILVGTRLASKHAGPVAETIRAVLEPLPPLLRQTLTFDNGTEFARHHELNPRGIATCFCDPHAPCQKGGIENAIGRMRRFLPRKTDLAKIDETVLTSLIAVYNNTPRRCLGWKTPAEVILKSSVALQTRIHLPAFAGMTPWFWNDNALESEIIVFRRF